MWHDKALALLLAAFSAAVAFGGCGSKSNGTGADNGGEVFTSSGGPGFGGNSSGTSVGVTCTNGMGWACSVNNSCGSGSTTLTGKVYDPAGKNPIYNVVVWVPNDASQLPAITPGTNSCNTCDVSIGDYVVATTTDATGSFTLTGVPTGKGVPVVVQIGKWRRMVAIDTAACQTTTVSAGTLRLPSNQSEGSMPQMALLTGGYDNLGCFMKKLGIDAKEYSSPRGGGRLDIYQGLNSPLDVTVGNGPGLSSGTAGNCRNASCPLWASKPSLEYYDIVLLACEGGEANQTKPAAGKQAMHDWLNEGGKVFATHFHYTWFKNSPAADFQSVATWLGSSTGTGMGQFTIDTSFPKGQTLHDWLSGVGALSNAGTIALNGVANSVSTVKAPTNRWIYDGRSGDTKYLSFGTPVGGLSGTTTGETTTGKYCGKAVFSDLHAGGAPSGDIPAACTDATMTPQEEALEFLFFDLSACVQDDSQPPETLPPPK
jgi:hypothetical protein